MHANEYQQAAMRTATGLSKGEQAINALLGLIGETGELALLTETLAVNTNEVDKLLDIMKSLGMIADKIKKHFYQGHVLDQMEIDRIYQRIRLQCADQTNGLPEGSKEGLFHYGALAELGDVQWYVALAATAHGVSLDEVMQANIDKLLKRYPQGFSAEASQNRSEGDV